MSLLPGGAWAALSHRPFRVYFLGQAISLIGLWMQQVAQGIVVVNLADSKAAFATVAVTASVPMVVLSLQGGVIADRCDRRRILMITQVGLAGLAFAYALLVWTGWLHMAHVYALAAVWGIIAAFDLPAQQALVPELVPAAQIPQAVALNQSLFHGSRLFGPALGTLLIGATSVGAAFVANGLSYFAVVWSLAVIRAAAPAAPPRPPPGPNALADGLRYVWRTRDVRALVGFTFLTTALIFPLLIVFMPVAVKEFFGDEHQLGILMSASGLGAMSGALSLLRIRAEARGPGIVIACVFAAALLVGFSFTRDSWTGAVVVTGLAYAVSLAMGLSVTIMQVTVPDELRGRVMGVHGLGFTALTPLAALALGLVADAIGLRTTLRIMSVAYVAIALPWLVRAGVWGFRAAVPDYGNEIQSR